MKTNIRTKAIVIAIFVLFLTAPLAVAIDIPVPAGYTPWFSVDLTVIPPEGGEVFMRPATDSLAEGWAYTVVAIGSNLTSVSPVSDPSPETLILPTNWPVDAQGKPVRPAGFPIGEMCTKSSLNPIGLKFTHGTGAIRYSSFYKSRKVYGACDKPGAPTLSK